MGRCKKRSETDAILTSGLVTSADMQGAPTWIHILSLETFSGAWSGCIQPAVSGTQHVLKAYIRRWSHCKMHTANDHYLQYAYALSSKALGTLNSASVARCYCSMHLQSV